MRRQIGDIYQIDLSEDKVGYMQHVAIDKSQLGSHVVKVFAQIYSADQEPDLKSIAGDKVAFYAHVLLRAGETLKKWRKVGRACDAGSVLPLWCTCRTGDMQKPVSYDWEVWHTDGERWVPDMSSQSFKDAELGLVCPPAAIISRLLHGKYELVHPRKP